MDALPLNFKLSDLAEGMRSFGGDLDPAAVAEGVKGMVGELGYETDGPVSVTGTAWLTGKEVVIEAHITTKLKSGCVRCLTDLTLPIKHRIHVLLSPEPAGGAQPEMGIEVTDDGVDDAEVAYYKGEDIDLRALLLEYLLLELPMNPSCALVGLPDDACSMAVKDEPQSEEEAIDPRWAPLLELKKKLH